MHKSRNGAARGIRTPDPIITNDVLYQLSYCGVRDELYQPSVGSNELGHGAGFGNAAAVHVIRIIAAMRHFAALACAYAARKSVLTVA